MTNASPELTPARTRTVKRVRAVSGLRPLTEAEFQANVCEAAELFGWRWAHFRPARTKHGWRTPASGPMGAGWPDLVLMRARDGRTIYAELKTDAGRLTPEQSELRDYMTDVTFLGRHTYAIWRPRDFDRIVEVLQ